MGNFGLLLGFQGRINRSQFWRGQLALIGLVIVVFLFLGGSIAATFANIPNFKTASADIKAQAATSAISFIFIAKAVWGLMMAWVGSALAIKRLHDLGKSGWWLLIFGVPGALAILLPFAPVQWAALAAKIWYVVELGFFKGDTYANRYDLPDGEQEVAARVSADLIELHRQDASRHTQKASLATLATGLHGRTPAIKSFRSPQPVGSPGGFGRRAR